MLVSNRGFVPLLAVCETRLVDLDVALMWLVDYTVALVACVVALPAMR